MPLYEYRCSGCGAVVEVNQAIAMRDLAPRCPTLDFEIKRGVVSRTWHDTHRVLTAPAIRGETVARS